MVSTSRFEGWSPEVFELTLTLVLTLTLTLTRFEGWSPEVFELLDNTPFEEIEQRDLYDRPPQVTTPPL